MEKIDHSSKQEPPPPAVYCEYYPPKIGLNKKSHDCPENFTLYIII